MPRLLGENVLPESVMNQRRRLRERVNDLREPIRSRRVEYIPGPDLIGEVEGFLTSARNRVLRREGFGMDMMNIRERLNGEDEENGNGEEEVEENSNTDDRGMNTDNRITV